MRKTQILTDKGSLKKSAKDKILNKINEIVEPIKAEREKQEQIQKELTRLELDTEELTKVDENSLEDMQQKLEALQKLLYDASIRYPVVTDEAKRALNSKVELIKGKIEIFNSKKDQRADEEMLNSLNRKINENSIEDLEKALSECREAYPKAKLAETKNKIMAIAEGLKNKIAELKAKEIAEMQPKEPEYEVIIEPAPKEEEPKEDDIEPKTKKYGLNPLRVFDFEMLVKNGVVAESEEEAKELLIKEFAELVNKSNLEIKE
jgi:hypothetical protein